jgi:ABC-2 type transport system ATP-binding protein
MKQKLAIISAFLHSPKLMILTSFVGLTPGGFYTQSFMKDLCRTEGLYSFPLMFLTLEKLCDRVAIIRGGKLVTEGLWTRQG